MLRPTSSKRQNPWFGRIINRCATIALITSMVAFSVPTTVAAAALHDVISYSATLTVWTSFMSWFNLTGFQTGPDREIPSWPANQQGNKPQPPPLTTELQSRVAAIKLNYSGAVVLQSRQPMLFAGVPLDSEGTTVQGLSVGWESSDNQIVFIRNNGQAVAGNPGKAILTATAGTATASVNVVVVASDTQKDFGGKKSRNSTRNSRQKAKANFLTESNTSRNKLASIKRQRPTRQNVSRSQFKNHYANNEAVSMAPIRLPNEDPLPDDETKSLYQPANIVGAPPGKAKPGATTRAVATNGTETNGNQNFSFGLPVVGLGGRGLNVSLSLIYNSQVWNKSTDPNDNSTWMTYDVDSGWPAQGFRLGFGQIEDQGSFGFTLIDANGTRHALDFSNVNTYDTTDGTFIRFIGGRGWGTLFYPDGTRVSYGAAGTGLRSYPTKVTDRNGNYVLISYVDGVGPKISSIQDTLQRFINFHYATNGDLVTITAPNLGGFADRQVMRFYYTDVTLGSNLFNSNISVDGPTAVHTLQYVYLPSSSEGANTRTGYKFDYSPYGMIRQLTQLRGMTSDSNSTSSAGSISSEGSMSAQTTYNYPTSGLSLTEAPKYDTRTDDWAGRTTGGSAPSYTFASSVGTGERLSTITAPDGTITETHAIDIPNSWNDGLVNRTVVKSGGFIYSNTVVDWEPTPGGGMPRIAAVRETDDGSTPLTKATVFNYTSFNNISSVSQRDFTSDGSISPTELRRTETVYVASSAYIGRRILHLPSSIKVFAGGSSIPTSRVDYAYDDYGIDHATLTSRNDIIMHDPSFDPFQPGEEFCEWVCHQVDPSSGQCVDLRWECTFSTPYDASTDARGNVTSITTYSNAANTSGASTNSMTYDIAGNPITVEVDCCQQKSFTYSGAGFNEPHDYAYVISVTNGKSGGTQLTSTATYDYNTGLPVTGTDENNQTATNFYNTDSLRLSRVTTPNGGMTLFTYVDNLVADASGSFHSLVETSTKLDNNGSGGAPRFVSIRRFFDGRGALARTMSFQGSDGSSTQDVEYDTMGRAYRTSNPYFAAGYSATPAAPSSMFWTTSQFDPLGRVVQVDIPRGDNNNSLLTSVTSIFDGIYTTVTDQAGKVRRQKVDALGRVIRLDEPTASGLGLVLSPNQPTHYVYDVLDNVVRVNQGSQNRYFKFDSLSRLIRERQPEQDTNPNYNLTDPLTGNSSWSRRTDYNSNGLITDAFDARGVHTQFSYDDLNRVTSITYSDGTPAAHYFYDFQTLPAGAPNTFAPDSYSRGFANGRMVAMTYGNGATGNYFGYDSMGRINMQFQLTGSTPAKYKLTYTYNLAGLLTTETYPSARALTYAYDEAGRPSSVSSNSTVLATGFQFAAHGGLKSETFGNGMVLGVDYNQRLQPTRVTLKQILSAITPLQQFDYSYGSFNAATGAVDSSQNNGQIGSITGKINGTTQWLQGFRYDELGRLWNVTEYQSANISLQSYSQSYSYDRYGNRFQNSNSTLGLPAVFTSDIVATTNRFINTGFTPTTYDAAGNVTIDTKFRVLKYDYDANGRQTAAKLLNNTIVQSSVYDCAGQRVQTIANNVTRTMVYDIFGQNVADYTGSSGTTLERDNIYHGGSLLATDEFVNSSAPGALAATPSGSNIGLSWSAVSGATNYRVERKSTGGSYTLISTTSSTSIPDNGVSVGNAYLYRVCVADGASNCISNYSNIALGMMVSFTDSTIVSYFDDPSNATPVRAAHITQLRTAVNTVRGLAGLPSASWTNNVAAGATIFADDVRELRTKLGEALTTLGIQTSPYTDSSIISFAEDPLNVTPVRAVHIRELRERVTRGAGPSSGSGMTGGLKYVLIDLQGSTRALMNNNGFSSVVTARHDYLPFGEEINAGIGLRTTGQGFNAPDTNRWKYGLTERDNATGLDHTPWRKYENFGGRWTSPDPYGGSSSIGDPQSFNRYSYVQNDPVNFNDPSGLFKPCVHKAMTRFLANLAGRDDADALALGAFNADSRTYSAISNPINILLGLFRAGPSANIHFANEAKLKKEIANFPGYIAAKTYEGYPSAGFVLHSIQDVHGAHQGYGPRFGHAWASIKAWFRGVAGPDSVIGDSRFMRAANETFQLLSVNQNISLTAEQTNDLIDAIIAECGEKIAKDLEIHKSAIGPRGGCTRYYLFRQISYDGGETWKTVDQIYIGCF